MRENYHSQRIPVRRVKNFLMRRAVQIMGIKVGGQLNKKRPVKTKSTENVKTEKLAGFDGKRAAATVAALMIFAGLIAAMFFASRPDPDAPLTNARKLMFARAKVISVLYDDTEPDYVRSEGRRLGKQELEVEILSGTHKGEILPLTNYLSALGNVYAVEGEKVIVQINTGLEDGGYYATMHNYDRGSVIGIFLLMFAALMTAIGGKKGIMALLGLIFTLAYIWFLMIPLMMKGWNVILVTVFVASVTCTASLLLLDGFSRKAVSAILACVAGVAMSGIVAWIVGTVTPINGFNMGDAESLILHATDGGMKISGLLICGVLISAMGAVMDVAMSIASAIHELYLHNPDMNPVKMISSGMNIGKDAIGTMANTLILAFTGSSLNMLVLVRAYDIPFIQLINTDFIIIEVLQSIAGSVGIILTVPFVSFIAAYLIPKGKKNMSA